MMILVIEMSYAPRLVTFGSSQQSHCVAKKLTPRLESLFIMVEFGQVGCQVDFVEFVNCGPITEQS
jgi:hypothetical protein